MKNDPFRLEVNGHFQFELWPEDLERLDWTDHGEGRLHVLDEGRSFHVEIVEQDPAALTYTLRVNGEKLTVRIHDYYERLVQELGLKVGGAPKENAVKAPMPGLVLRILVEPGQEVAKGDPLLILEAMKMENVLKAQREGRIRTVAVATGHAVEKGALLLEID